MRYFFDQDDDGHWYMIPQYLMERWYKYLMERWHTAYEDVVPDQESEYDKYFSKYKLGGGINYIFFQNPIDEDGKSIGV